MSMACWLPGYLATWLVILLVSCLFVCIFHVCMMLLLLLLLMLEWGYRMNHVGRFGPFRRPFPLGVGMCVDIDF